MLLADGGLLDGIGGIALTGVGIVLLIALLAGKGNMGAGAALMVLFLSGDPDERDASGANENEALKKFALAITPSAWKKAYLGDNGDERDSDGDPVLLDLPAWQGDEARALVEPEAVTNVKSMQLATIDVPSLGPVDLSGWRTLVVCADNVCRAGTRCFLSTHVNKVFHSGIVRTCGISS